MNAIIDDYTAGSTILDIRRTYKIGTRKLYKILDAHNITRRGRNKCEGNEHYFDSLNGYQACYWFGFFVADGSITGSSPSLKCNLQVGDKDHLELFKIHSKYTGKISEYTYYDRRYSKLYHRACLQWGSKYLCAQLYKLGLSELKNGDHTPIDDFTSKQFKAFLFGFFDGDGSIYKITTAANWRWYICSPHKTLIEHFMSKCPVVSRHNAIRNKKNGIWKVQYNGNQVVRRICRWLLDCDVESLDRKKRYIIDASLP